MGDHDLCVLLERLEKSALDLGDERVKKATATLSDKMRGEEWHLLMLGETSSGKSALVNSMLQSPILPERSVASTAVVCFVQTGSSSVELAGFRPDGSSEPLDTASFEQACLGKLGFAATRAAVPGRGALPPGVVVVDTPGYNSCLTEHTEVLVEYLPFSDAVVFVTSWRRGITQEDVRFLEAVRRCAPAGESLPIVAAINFCRSDEPDARSEQMTAALRNELGQDLEVILIPQARGVPRRIESQKLWARVAARVDPAAIHAAAKRNAAFIGAGLCGVLEEELRRKREAITAREAGIRALMDRMRRIEQEYARAREVVAEYEAKFDRIIEAGVQHGVQATWRRSLLEIDEASRFLDKSSCEHYVREHIVPFSVEKFQFDVGKEIEAASASMAGALDDICQRADAISFGDPVVAQGGPGEMIGNAGNAAVKEAAIGAAQAYLGRLGGAAGAKAGFVNFAKMAVSKTGRLFGKKFSRAVYDGMGQLLKRMGLTASRAVSTFAAVLVDTVRYAYDVMTWKASLRAVVAHTLGLPVEDEPLLDRLKQKIPLLSEKIEPVGPLVRREYRAAVAKLVQDTRELVEEDFSGRLKPLHSSAEEKSTDIDGARRQLDGLDAAIVDLEHGFKAIAEGAGNGT